MQRQMRGLKDGSHAHGEGLAAFVALVEAKAGGLALHLANAFAIGIAAMRANRALRPKTALDISKSGFFGLELRSGKNGVGHGYLQ